MTKNAVREALAAFAALNPVPSDRLAALASTPECERTHALIVAHPRLPPGHRNLRHSRLRLAALAVGLTVVLVVPALASSGRFGSLFGFSNDGTTVDTGDLDLQTASALDIVGAAPGTLKLLASRADVGIYAARGNNGNLCYFVGPPQPGKRGLSGGCMNAAASAKFPSPEQPVVDMTAFVYKPGATSEQVTRLAGVAADGVATMQVLGENCTVIAAAPVTDNVYINTKVPDKPAVAIQALNQNGDPVYRETLRFWDRSACDNETARP
jgi:hypothetical protein